MVSGSSASRSRNTQGKQHLTHQHHKFMGTGPISYQVHHNKFEGNNLLDLNFKTNNNNASSHHQSKNVSGTNNNTNTAIGNFSTINAKQQQNLLPGSTTNNSAFIN